MKRLLSYPIHWPNADVRNVGDLLSLSGCYGCVIALAVMFATFPYWSV